MKVLLTVVLNEDGQMVAEGDPLTPLESMAVFITVQRYMTELAESLFEPILNPVSEPQSGVLIPCRQCVGTGKTMNGSPCPICQGKGHN